MTAVVSSCNRAPLDTYRMLTRLFSRLFSRTPSASVPELLQRGYGLQRAGDAQGAERAYRDVLKLESHNADAHHLLGALLGERGELTAAATHLRPMDLMAHPDLGPRRIGRCPPERMKPCRA